MCCTSAREGWFLFCLPLSILGQVAAGPDRRRVFAGASGYKNGRFKSAGPGSKPGPGGRWASTNCPGIDARVQPVGVRK